MKIKLSSKLFASFILTLLLSLTLLMGLKANSGFEDSNDAINDTLKIDTNSVLVDSTQLVTIKNDSVEVKEDYTLEYYQTGGASWYGLGDGYHGRKTASGEIFNTYAMTAAHKKLKFGTIVRVTNLKNEKWVDVKINDRGPFVKGRVIDLSYAAKNKIDMGGVAQVKLEIIHKNNKK